MVKNNDNGFMFKKYVEQYCSIIPQKVHGKINCYSLFPNLKAVNNQNDVLNSLKDSINIINDLKSQNTSNESSNIPKLFNCSITEVNDDKIIKKINNLFNKTHQNVHACRNLKIKTIYEINIDSMNKSYESTKNSWISDNKKLNEQLLWHGTKNKILFLFLKME